MHKASGMAMAAASSSNSIIIICIRWYQLAARSIMEAGGEGRDDDGVPHGRTQELDTYICGRENKNNCTGIFFYFYFFSLSLPFAIIGWCRW